MVARAVATWPVDLNLVFLILVFLRKVHIFVVLLEKRKFYFEMNHFSATFQTQGNILNETYTQVGSPNWISE